MSDRAPWFAAYEAATNPSETQTFRIHGEQVHLRERTIKVGGGSLRLSPPTAEQEAADKASRCERRARLSGEVDYE